ncbi:hypothetical protein [Burkholderia cepacia]|uniref:hypothetical protein n=1 Tax=Burkholderia cepacia TaxID=292 RepID=UPI002AB71A45|nr:hypothetical protein [Burkholderia cepacia]
MINTSVSLVVTIFMIVDLYKRVVSRAIERAIWRGCRPFVSGRAAALCAQLGTALLWLVVFVSLLTPRVIELISILKR